MRHQDSRELDMIELCDVDFDLGVARIWADFYAEWQRQMDSFGIDAGALLTTVTVEGGEPDRMIGTWWPADAAKVAANTDKLLQLYREDCPDRQAVESGIIDGIDRSPQWKLARLFGYTKGNPEAIAAVLIASSLFDALDGRMANKRFDRTQEDADRYLRYLKEGARIRARELKLFPLSTEITAFASATVPGDFHELCDRHLGSSIERWRDEVIFRWARVLTVWRPTVIRGAALKA